jgi:hypothetical protein
MKLPRSVPILSAFAARVCGCELPNLLQSPTLLARAVADTQKVIGHDGVLCFFEPSVLVSSCLAASSGQQWVGVAGPPVLRPADEVSKAAPLANLLQAIPVLRHVLPADALIIASMAGPGLLAAQLAAAPEPCGGNNQIDPEYVTDVVRTAVRAALELKADGIALLEETDASPSAEWLRCHRTVRKLADFYDAAFILFSLSVARAQDFAPHAHCIFELPAGGGGGLVAGRLDPSIDSDFVPVTTAADVPASTTVEELKALLRSSQRR